MTLDRWDEIRVIGVASVILCVAGLWGWTAGASGAYAELLASRFVAGVAVGIVWTGSASLVGAAITEGERASATAAFTTSSPVGLAIGQFTTPLFVPSLGWEVALAVYGTFAIIGFCILASTTRYRSMSHPLAAQSDHRASYQVVLTDRTVWSVCLMAFVTYSLYSFFNGWLPTYLVERFEFSVAHGGLFAALFAGAGIISRTLGGVLSDRVFGGRRRPPILTSLAVSTPIVIAVGAVSNPFLVIVLLFPAELVIQLSVGVYYAYVTELVIPSSSGVALGVLGTVGVFGSFPGPVISGILIEGRGGYATAFAYAAVLGCFGVFLVWRTPEPERLTS